MINKFKNEEKPKAVKNKAKNEKKSKTIMNRSKVMVRWSLKARLLFLVIASLIITSAVISYIAYDKSKASTTNAVENRLEREAEIFYQMAKI